MEPACKSVVQAGLHISSILSGRNSTTYTLGRFRTVFVTEKRCPTLDIANSQRESAAQPQIAPLGEVPSDFILLIDAE